MKILCKFSVILMEMVNGMKFLLFIFIYIIKCLHVELDDPWGPLQPKPFYNSVSLCYDSMILWLVLNTKPYEPDVPSPPVPGWEIFLDSQLPPKCGKGWLHTFITEQLPRNSFVVSYVFERNKLHTESTDSIHWSMPAIEHSMVYLIWLWTLSLFSMPKWSSMVE